MITVKASYFALRGILLPPLLLIAANLAFAQDGTSAESTDSTELFSLTGSVSLTADFYDFSADPSGTQAGRRPPRLYRLVFNPTLNIGGLVSLPFNIMLTMPETNVTTPLLQNPTIGEFALNPANALGFSSFAPRIGWAQLFLGSHTPQYSTLSNSDLPLFGAGLDLQPFGMRLAASGGVVQRAIEPDSARGVQAMYGRSMYMGRLGTAESETVSFGVNVVYTQDVVQSLQNNIIGIVPSRTLDEDSSVVVPADTIRLRPEAGMMASADVMFALSNNISFKAEGAVSSFTRDQTSEIKAVDGNPLDAVSTTRVSTRVDYAATASMNIKDDWWSLAVTSLYMGAGYVPLAQPYQQSDRLEWRIAPSTRFFDGNLLMTATVGHRINNLSGTRGETMSQFLVGGTVTTQLSEEFSMLLRYTNFGVQNDRDLDTLRVKNVNQSFGIEPSLMIDGNDVLHTLNASVGLDTYEDFNIISGVESSNDMRSATFNYLGSIKSFPLSIGANASYLENILFTGLFIVRSVGGMLSYRLFNGSVTPTVSITSSTTSFGSSPADEQVFFKLAVRWRITKSTNMNASYGNNNYLYGNPTIRGASFTERILQLAFSASF